MSGGGGSRVLDGQSAPVNVRQARATASSHTNYPGHHGAQDASLRIALLLRHSKRDTVSCQEFGDKALRVLREASVIEVGEGHGIATSMSMSEFP
jgi:predicted Fe-Mo cluster-binding NifX family protein